MKKKNNKNNNSSRFPNNKQQKKKNQIKKIRESIITIVPHILFAYEMTFP